VKYIYGEYFYMILPPGTCNIRGGPAAREYWLRYYGRRNPDANTFQRLKQRLYGTPAAHVNIGRPWILRTPASHNAMIAPVEPEPWISSRGITG
jgi:hypothetical protein